MPAQWTSLPLLVAAALVAYGNASTYLTAYIGVGPPGGLLVPNLIGVGLLLLWAVRGGGLSPAGLGLRREGASGSVAWGALAGGLMALPALAAFAFPPLLPVPIEYHPVASLSLAQFILRVLVQVPLATALCEELAFRGVLQALFCRSLAPLPAIAATNVAFALWHGVVNYRTVFETNVAAAPHLVPLALGAGLVGVFVGGVIFSLLRHYTGSLAGSVAAHWAVDGLMLAALYPWGK